VPEAADTDAEGGVGGSDSRGPDRAAFEHLRRADPVLARLLDENGVPDLDWRLPSDNYAALVRGIVGQQLSTYAARAIWGRLLERFGGRPPTPKQILADDPDELRVAAGLSHAKVRYLRSLAENVESGELELDRLEDLSDDEVLSSLTAVKGIGPWSADLFLMFQLDRPDVLAAGDLGIRRAVQQAYDLPERPSIAAVTALGERWRPYRTAASLVLWQSLRSAPV
jgi:DNA-3-methyladenine glycosylase II